jgi:hypothetical protein
MYFGDYLLVNLGRIRGGKFLGPSAFGENQEPLLIGYSGTSLLP